MIDRLPPQSIESEESILSALLISGYDDRVDCLSPDVFYRTAHQKIFKAIKQVHAQDVPVELVSVMNAIRQNNELEEVGGASYLARIVDNIPSTDSLEHYCNIIIDKAVKRKLIAQYSEIIKTCYEDKPSDQIAIEQRKVCEIEIPIEKSQMIKQVREWVSASPGEFTVIDIDRDLKITEPWQKILRTSACEKLIEDGMLERCGNRRGYYRPIDGLLIEQDFMGCDGRPIELWLPFELTSKVDIFSRNIITLGGEKNAGKTALLLNIAYCNRSKFSVHYFNSEMGDQELKRRLIRFKDGDLSQWGSVKFYERARDFSDVIFSGPQDLNLIDFLELSDEFWKVGQLIRNIHDKMGDSICIVALQKKAGADNPRGGEFVKEKARLHLDLTNDWDSEYRHKLKINPGKNWCGNENPNGKYVKFKITQGSVLSPLRDHANQICWFDEERISKKRKTI